MIVVRVIGPGLMKKGFQPRKNEAFGIRTRHFVPSIFNVRRVLETIDFNKAWYRITD